MTPSTVYDRVQKTGYITGSRHNFGAAMSDEPDAQTPGSDAGGPPNLRDTEAPQSCADCEHFDASTMADDSGEGGGARCNQFDTSVTPNQVCDAFQAKGDDTDGEETGPEGQAADQARP